jgi:hypothetical protein
MGGALYLAKDKIRLIRSFWVEPGALASAIVFKLGVGSGGVRIWHATSRYSCRVD